MKALLRLDCLDCPQLSSNGFQIAQTSSHNCFPASPAVLPLGLESENYLNKSTSRTSATEMECASEYERKRCQTRVGNYYWAVPCRTKSCWQARPSGMFGQEDAAGGDGHPPFLPRRTNPSLCLPIQIVLQKSA